MFNGKKRRLLALILAFVSFFNIGVTAYAEIASNLPDTDNVEGEKIILEEEIDGMTIRLSADKGVIDESSQLSVKGVSEEEKKDYLESISEEKDYRLSNFHLLDIDLLDEAGEKIQPRGKVKLEFLNTDLREDVDDVLVYHLDKKDSGDVSIEDMDGEKKDKDVSFETDHFSIYLVADTPTVTYEYYVGDRLEYRQILKNGETLLDPGIPQSQDSKYFKGWYTEDGKRLDFRDENNKKTIVKDISEDTVVKVHAKFKGIYYVHFEYDGQVVHTEAVKEEDGNKLEVNDELKIREQSIKKPGKVFSHWSAKEAGDPFDFHQEIKGDMKLYAVLKDGYQVKFETDGGSFVDPKFVGKGDKIKDIKNPSKAGYTFKHWSKDKGGKEFDFETPIDKDMILYAVWAPGKANYTVRYWQENANNTEYTLKHVEVIEGSTGGNVSNIPPLDKKLLGDKYVEGFDDHFTYKKSDTKKIEADGSTIINVYYDRNKYNVKFIHDGKVLYNKNHKHGETLNDAWKIAENYKEYKWGYKPQDRDGFVTPSKAPIMLTRNVIFETRIKGDVRYRYRPRFKEGNKVVGYGGYIESESKSIDNIRVSIGKLPTPGFERISDNDLFIGGVKEGDNIYVDIPVKRLKYSLSFRVNDGSNGISSRDILYEGDISGLKPKNYVIGATRRSDGYIFKGWYESEIFEGKLFEFNKMPAREVILHAKWEPPTHKVKINKTPYKTSNPVGGRFETKTVDHGKTLAISEDLLTVEGVELVIPSRLTKEDFIGWYWYPEGNKAKDLVPFDLTMPIKKDIELFPVWENKDYGIRYDSNDGDGEVVDTNRYFIDSQAPVLPANRVTHPDGERFIGWRDKNGTVYYPNNSLIFSEDLLEEGKDYLILRAIWDNKIPRVELVYNGNGGETINLRDKTYVRLDNNDRHTILSAREFARNGYQFKEWNESPDGSGKTYEPGTEVRIDKDGKNVLYAIWEKDRPSLSLEKKALTEHFEKVGDTINYSYTVTNTGNVDIEAPFEIVDDKIGKIEVGKISENKLSPGEEFTVEASYKVTEKDVENGYVTNTAKITGRYTNDPENPDLPVEEEDRVVVGSKDKPVLKLEKKAEQTKFSRPGDRLTYSYTITNIGKAVAKGPFVLNDDKIGELKIGISELSPGQSYTTSLDYTVTEEDVKAGFVKNIATIDSEDPDYPGEPSNPDNPDDPGKDIVVVDKEEKPNLKVKKTANKDSFKEIGEEIIYYFEVKNTGNTVIEGPFDIYDDKIGWIDTSTAPTELEPGTAFVVEGSYKVTKEDAIKGEVTNNVKVKGVDPNNPDKPVEEEDKVTVKPKEKAPSLRVKKSANKNSFEKVGDKISYSYEISNIGTADFDGKLSLDDDKIGEIFKDKQVKLAIGESFVVKAIYSITEEDMELGSVENLASLTGGNIDPEDPVEDRVVVDKKDTPRLSLVKEAKTSSFEKAGDEIEYSYTIKNIGNTRVNGPFKLYDDKIGYIEIEDEPEFLEVGEEFEVTKTYKVTEEDVSKGYVTNTAKVAGVDPNNPDQPVEEEDRITVGKNGEGLLDLEKTSESKEFVNVGDKITYSYRITNIGNKTVEGPFEVLDNKIPNINMESAPDKLEPGDSFVVKGIYTIREEDLERGYVENIATIDGSDPDLPVDPDNPGGDSVVVNKKGNPKLDLEKTSKKKTFTRLGEEIVYSYKVTNTGNVTIKAPFEIEDDKIGKIDTSKAPKELKIGESFTVEGSYKVTEEDMEKGHITNLATIKGVDPNNPDEPVEEEDKVVINKGGTPILVMEKTAKSDGFEKVGDRISYGYTVSNIGDVIAKGPFTVEDDKIDDIDMSEAPDELKPGESFTVTADYKVTEEDMKKGSVKNIAKVKTDDPNVPDNEGEPDDPGEDTVVVDKKSNPKLSLDKKLSGGEFKEAGDKLIYSYTVTNTGNVDIDGPFEIYDDKIGEIDTSEAPAVLKPGESFTVTAEYEATDEDVEKGYVTNTAKVTGVDPNNPDQPVEEEDKVTVVKKDSPLLKIEKSADTDKLEKVGQVITYTYKITNIGDGVAKGPFTVLDDKIDFDDIYITSHSEESEQLHTFESLNHLEANGWFVAKGKYTVTKEDMDRGYVTNIAKVKTDDPNVPDNDGRPDNPGEDTVTVGKDKTARLEVKKSADKKTFTRLGEEIEYTFVIRNIGNVRVNGPFKLYDDKIGEIRLGEKKFLEPGESMEAKAKYRVTKEDIERGLVTNIAKATGVDPNDPDKPVDGEDKVTVNKKDNPRLEVRKTANKERFTRLGETITYSYEIKNTGTVDVRAPFELTDDKIGKIDTSRAPEVLKVGESFTVKEKYKITEEDMDRGYVTNIAKVVGVDPENPDQPVDGEDKITVNKKDEARLGLEKKAIDKTFNKAGDIVKYSYKVTNLGDVDVKAPFAIVDDKIGEIDTSEAPEVLKVGESFTVEADYKVTDEDVEKGYVTNTAKVTGVDPNNPDQPVEEEDKVVVGRDKSPLLRLEKSANAEKLTHVGQVITYTYKVTNIGTDVAKKPFEVLDNKIEDIDMSKAPEVLEVGESFTVTADYTVTKEDMDKGSVRNVATIDGKEPTDPVDPDNPGEDVVVVDKENTPRLELKKEAVDKTFDKAGDKLSYSYTVTNTGNVTIKAPFEIVDDKIGKIDTSKAPDELEPGKSFTVEADYTVTDEDVEKGYVTNTAKVTGVDPNNPDKPVEEEDKVVVGKDKSPLLRLEKSADAEKLEKVGQVITYTYKVTNIGDGVAKGPFTVLDDKIVDIDMTEAPIELKVGESFTVKADYTVTKEDMDKGSVRNVATIDGKEPTDPVDPDNPGEDVVVVDKGDNKKLSLEKSVDKKEFTKIGEKLVYSYKISNIGSTEINGPFELTDNKIPNIDMSKAPKSLAPGDSFVISADYEVTEEDIRRGSVENIARVLGYDPEDPKNPIEEEDKVIVNKKEVFKLKLDKTVNKDSFTKVGEEVIYSYKVTNVGNMPVDGPFEITDDKIAKIDMSKAPKKLDLGESFTIHAKYYVTEEDLDKGYITNIANVTGDYERDPLDPEEEDKVTIGRDRLPLLKLEKSADKEEFEEVGDKIVYSYKVTNIGRGLAKGPFEIRDDKIANINMGLAPETLEPGKSFTITADYLITEEDVKNGYVTNVARVKGGDRDYPEDPDDPEEDLVTVIKKDKPILKLEKSADTDELRELGQTITYFYKVTNIGRGLAEGPFELTDDKIDNIDMSEAPESLAPGDSFVISAEYIVTKEDINKGYVKNIAKVSGEDPDEPVEDELVVGKKKTTILNLEKYADRKTYREVGEEVTYFYKVTNIGNKPVEGPFKLTDDKIEAEDIDLSKAPKELGVGESFVATGKYKITEADMESKSVKNIARVIGDYKVDPKDPTDPEQAEYEIYKEDYRKIDFEKSADKKSFKEVGEKIIYSYKVTNSGNVDIKIPLNIFDDKIAHGNMEGKDVALKPGESETFKIDYEVTEEDFKRGYVKNVAKVTGLDPEDPNKPVEEEDVVIVPREDSPVLNLEKTANKKLFEKVGDRITYSYKITNTGTAPAEGPFKLYDDKIRDIDMSKAPKVLGVGESFTVTADYTVTKEDFARGYVKNHALIIDKNGEEPEDPNNPIDPNDPEDKDIPERDTEIVGKDKKPLLKIDKTADRDVYEKAGDIITYHYRVTNIGDLIASGPFKIYDDKIGDIKIEKAPGHLEPGESFSVVAEYEVTEEDLLEPHVINIVTIGGKENLDPEDPNQPNHDIVIVDNKDKIRYTVEYYKDGSLFETIKHSTTRDKSIVEEVSYSNMPAGYELNKDRSTKLPFELTDEDNIIRVYYDKKDSGGFIPPLVGKKYKVEYYTDGELLEIKEYKIGAWNHLVKEVDYSNMPEGYELDKESSTELPFKVTSKDNVIKVYYIKDSKLNKTDHFAYIQGYPDNTVRPEGKITREEVAAVFFRLLDEDYREEVRTDKHQFKDVSSKNWSQKHIATLANAGILDGYEDGSFRPRKNITRGELAKVASQFDELSPSKEDKFTDIKNHWARKFINSASEKGWVKGYEDGSYRPSQDITRAEFVTLVNGVLERRVHEEDILKEARQFKDLPKKWYYEAMQEAINSHRYDRKEDGYEKWTEIYYPEIEM